MKRLSALSLFALATTLIVVSPPLAARQVRGAATSPAPMSDDARAKATAALKSGLAYLKKEQAPDGLWDKNVGVSGVAALAILGDPTSPKADALQTVNGTLDQMAKLAKPDGGIYDKIIPYYITAVSVSTMAAAGRPQDQPLVKAGAKYLVENMLDEGEGIAKSDFWYGGMGYGGATRPDRKADIISLEYALHAMHDAELPGNDAAWQKAMTFLQRTQNRSESNDQKWAGNDGGFVYYPGFSYSADGPTRSYGSATYAGVLSYTWANLAKDDPRVQAVVKWAGQHYTVDENPGMGQKTVYYYYMVLAKALAAVGDPTIVDAKGRSHNWRNELTRKLVSLQHKEGYWVNPVADEMQDNPRLVTAFVAQTLEAILK